LFKGSEKKRIFTSNLTDCKEPSIVVPPLFAVDTPEAESSVEAPLFQEVTAPLSNTYSTTQDPLYYVVPPELSTFTNSLDLPMDMENILQSPSVEVETSVEVPVEAPIQAPVQALTEVPVEAPVEAPIQAPVQALTEVPVEAEEKNPIDLMD
jgi:hypothetical protein